MNSANRFKHEKNAFNKLLPISCHRTKPASEISQNPFLDFPGIRIGPRASGSALEGKQKVDLSERENRSKAAINSKNAFGGQVTSLRFRDEFTGTNLAFTML